MTDFDWAWPTRLDRAAIEAALRLDFVAAGRNLVLVASQGLGKTMIAQNIAHQAVLAGHRVVFLTAAQLLLDLGGQDSARSLARRLQYYSQQGLLLIDEIGYLSYDARAADLLFQVVSRRYEKRSLVLTTNLSFSDWSSVFPNATTVTALIDRVVHHADIITIEGDSYRRSGGSTRRRPPPCGDCSGECGGPRGRDRGGAAWVALPDWSRGWRTRSRVDCPPSGPHTRRANSCER